MKYLNLYENNTNKAPLLSLIEGKPEFDLDDIIKIINSGIKLNDTNEFGYTALIYSCINYHDTIEYRKMSVDFNIQITKALIDAGAKLNIKDKDGKTALIHAAIKNKYFNNYQTLIDLIAANADYTIKDEKGKDFLDYIKKDKTLQSILKHFTEVELYYYTKKYNL